MKEQLINLLGDAVRTVAESWGVPQDFLPEVVVEQPKEKKFGDFASNIAMQMASVLKRNPRDIAAAIQLQLADTPDIEQASIAGPGFINVTLSKTCWQQCLARMCMQGKHFGDLEMGAGRRVMVEFVSANPTGPLHIGHGRGAAVGDSLARILRKAGYTTISEYYINDAGNQMETLGRSLQWRYLELLGRSRGEYPESYYQGDYLTGMARKLRGEQGDELVGKEGEETSLPFFIDYASEAILAGIRDDLISFGISFDNWTSEKQFFQDGKVDAVIEDLKTRGVLYEKDDALWFASSRLGDEKDRVVVRSNGVKTYFASDIAYHQDKHERGFDLMIDVWGADHHGYVPRLTAALDALGIAEDAFRVVLVQLVNLMRSGQPVAMSTRAGQFVTLDEVVQEVGKDAARFFFLLRRPDSHLDFDLELAKAQNNENPVYYVQYAHARLCSILRKAREAGINLPEVATADLSRLILDEEMDLIKKLDSFPAVIESAARYLEPHRVTYFVSELAALFHSYYNKNRVISDDRILTGARLLLVAELQLVLQMGLGLLGIDAPTSM
ncbi:MAG: arginine--tRNA ligase [Deltaproteobacteria bacterium]|nr:arginine--tRNA ligase [Candidatus Anaeroferrophillus wilburensis]MBN2889883.1 arginine--tRNA ligase [Deltaproteobacteria bacterium]